MAKQEVIKFQKNTRLSIFKKYANNVHDNELDLVFEFHGDLTPGQIIKFIEWANDEYKINVVIRHAELREYLIHAVAGAAVGGIVILAAAAKIPITWPLVATGMAIGGIIAACSTTLEIRIYKYKGKTRMRLATS